VSGRMTLCHSGKSAISHSSTTQNDQDFVYEAGSSHEHVVKLDIKRSSSLTLHATPAGSSPLEDCLPFCGEYPRRPSQLSINTPSAGRGTFLFEELANNSEEMPTLNGIAKPAEYLTSPATSTLSAAPAGADVQWDIPRSHPPTSSNLSSPSNVITDSHVTTYAYGSSMTSLNFCRSSEA